MIKTINKSDEKMNFLTDMPISLANAIRRSVNYIPILAIDTLEITKNDSALYDEILAHRVGLIPLKNVELKLPEECTCKDKGCGKCSLKYKIKAKGPSIVHSTEMTPKGDIIHKMPLTILEKDQELEFVAVAKIGIGKTHAKFTPGLIYYKYSDDVDKGDVKEDDEAFKKIVEESDKDENRELSVFIESWGQIKANEIFTKAIEALNKNLKEFLKSLK